VEYGEFNEEDEEEKELRYYQTGRFFGVGVGIGTSFADGNRGLLWRGGTPSYELKLVYWFDHLTALDMSGFVANHFYQTNRGSTNITFNRIGAAVKFFVDTRHLSAPITFASPYLLVGASYYSKAELSSSAGVPDTSTAVGVNGGFGLEFPIQNRKVYLALEGRLHLINFADINDTSFSGASSSPRLADLSGNFYTGFVSVMFIW